MAFPNNPAFRKSTRQSVSSQSAYGERQSVTSNMAYSHMLSYQDVKSSNLLDSIHNFLIETTDYIGKNILRNTREKCSCDFNLENSHTCSWAYSILFLKYEKNDLKDLKNTYNNILASGCANI